MLEALRDRLALTDVSIWDGLRQLPALYKPSTSDEDERPTNDTDIGDFDVTAGAHLLNHYENVWARTRHANEVNVAAAEQCERRLLALTTQTNEASGVVLQLDAELAALPAIDESIARLTDITESLAEQCRNLDSSLTYLEAVCLSQEHDERKLEAKYQLTLYREHKIEEMAQKRDEMLSKYVSVTGGHGRLQSKTAAGPSVHAGAGAALHRAFQQDMQIYRATGIVATSAPPVWPDAAAVDERTSAGAESAGDGRTLDDVTVDVDDDEQRLLEDFLADVQLADTAAGGV